MEPKNSHRNSQFKPSGVSPRVIVDSASRLPLAYANSSNKQSDYVKDKKQDPHIPVKQGDSKPIGVKLTYETLDRNDVLEMNMGKCMKKLALFLLSKAFELTIIILIIIYTLFVFVALGLQDLFEGNTDLELSLQIIELIILGFFLIQVSLKFIAFRRLYICDKWNIFDVIVILVSIVFVILEINLSNSGVTSLFRVRGIFRLLRIFLVLRKMNELRVRSTRRLLRNTNSTSFKTPAERILKILMHLISRVTDVKVKMDLMYCQEQISKNRLYEAELDQEMAPVMLEWVHNIQGLRGSQGNELSIESGQVSRRLSTTGAYVSQLEDKILDQLKNAADTSFDPFELSRVTHGQELVTLIMYLYSKNGWNISLNGLEEAVMYKFIKKIQDGYKLNSYHNQIHACDIAQTVYYFCTHCEFQRIGKLSELEVCILTITGAIHDYEHGGVNNSFLAKTKDPLAIRYNDQSVLQNHHVAASFELMSSSSMNIFKYLDQGNYKKLRHEIIKMVLGTDMAFHFKTIGVIKNRLSSADFDPSDSDKSLCMETLVHFADISASAKEWDRCYRWTNLLFVEFFGQGDKERERGFAISDLMDRNIVNVAKAQIGFIDFIVKPCFEILDQFILHMDFHLLNLESNKANWKERFDEYQELKNTGNNTGQQVSLSSDLSMKHFLKDSPVDSNRGTTSIIERRESKPPYIGNLLQGSSSENSPRDVKQKRHTLQSNHNYEEANGPLLGKKVVPMPTKLEEDLLDQFQSQAATKDKVSQGGLTDLGD